mmetsp:Transcript_32353/g.49515  ORF Transcript_32353/g.49515 Transcript_32353/m.49515 type:complete len:82 (+) Transcript_32353:93-338(+)|eukprot:CAMPEP_0170485812 /NCGR_PEP_ID=MMETSP0208-20121228/4977_1 /TAXON_ID=197538 /ORGANISM="Strombidium inclinatum, Strain S3" /LENGTH=81 /DNA_ID=CAMNT_0010759561 /DNA_START=30 /DNA_END=275 /DNA_ORIENTATION=+
MPKEIKDLKEFIKIMRREKKHLPQAEKITIKKNKKTHITKFKLRTPRYLYTLKVNDKTQAERIQQAIPPTLKKDDLSSSKK